MKLIRFGEINKEKPGIIINDEYYDTSSFGEDYNEYFFETDGLNRLQKFIDSNKDRLPGVSKNMRLGCPVTRPSKIICIGLNYANHAKETNAKIPTEPIIFFKSTTALCGPFDDVIIPKNSTKTDWEVMQNSNTNNFIFKIPFLVSYISGFMTMLPGDVISTGTPAGVGLGMKPQVYLKDGDIMELGIEGLRSSKQNARPYAKN
jgi:2-keto-4-pentenoate hydratase/2-oxohepta-3-ene-1,7-dioic acid hydratase in catechol pathway